MRHVCSRSAALVGAALLLAAPAAADVVEVRVYNFDFSAAPSGEPVLDPTIRVGDTIRWVWEAPLHDTVSAAGYPEQWDSAFQSPGATFEHTFTHVGTFPYYCSAHGFDNGDGTVGGMAGFIHVVCRGDFNMDGDLNVADFSAFRNAFLAGDLAADYSGDGLLSVADFTAFRSAFLEGCPS